MDKKDKPNKNGRIMEYLENTSQLVGTRQRELIDTDTGETIMVEQTLRFNYGSKHFWKCYMTDFLKVIEALEGRHIKIFTYIIRKTKSSSNLFICTYQKMAEDLNCSKQTISETMKILQKKNFIRKKQNGIWIINPNILVKGNDVKRNSLFSEYVDAQPIKKTKKKKGKGGSREQEQGNKASAENNSESSKENSKESSEENHRNPNDTDDSDRETNIDKSHLSGHSDEQEQGEEVNEKTPI